MIKRDAAALAKECSWCGAAVAVAGRRTAKGIFKVTSQRSYLAGHTVPAGVPVSQCPLSVPHTSRSFAAILTLLGRGRGIAAQYSCSQGLLCNEFA